MDECAQCHGEHGKGDGPKAMMHSPRQPTSPTLGRMSTVTDGEIFYQISEGRKPMPSFKETADRRSALGACSICPLFLAANHHHGQKT